MKPITFTCEDTLSLTPDEIVGLIMDPSNWCKFRGYGPIPGIKSAEFEVKTPAVVGSRVRVTETNGSTHVEEFVEWQPGRRLQQVFSDFSPPLSRLATGMEETWEFSRTGDSTRVLRSFKLHPKSALSRPILWLISLLLKRAIARNLREMR
ncbi:MAG TPA: SRPBCC family protein [Planctomycetaceae bacterium]|nr:SRPBCC family protein [Planctomycetaceae bacterium]